MSETLPIKASTQDHLDIDDIVDDLVIQKNGTVTLILQTTALNFGLLSETEQDTVIYSYAALLNSLTFPIQIVIRSRRSDISSYLEKLNQAERTQTNKDLQQQITKYKEFIVSTVVKNEVLEKKFYLIIPFSLYQLGAKGTLVSFSKKKKGTTYSKTYLLEQADNELYPKRDHLIKQLARIGLSANQLTNHELIELYYDIYNPTAVGLQKVAAEAGSYTTPIIEPSIAKGKPTPQAQIPLSPQPQVQTSPPQPQIQNQPQPQPAIPGTQASKNPTQVLGELQTAVSRANQLVQKRSPLSDKSQEGQS